MANRKALQLNDKSILALEKPKIKRWIRDGGGLTLCLTTAEKGMWRQWYFIYQSPETGKKCYKPLGPYPALGLSDARRKSEELTGELRKGIDPMAEERRAIESKIKSDKEKRLAREAEEKAITVSKLVEEYIEKHAKKFKKSWEEDERILNKEVVTRWGKRKASEVSRRDVILLLEKIMERGAPIMSNLTFAVIRKMFNFAVERDILQISPATGLKMLAPKVARDRVLSEAELIMLWNNLDAAKMSGIVKRALKLILITGQRPGEIVGLHSKEIEGHWWTLPVERAKNKIAHRVYLTDMALELIGDLVIKNKTTGKEQPKGYIFPTPVKKNVRPIEEKALSKAIRNNLALPVLDNSGNPQLDDSGMPVSINILGVEHFTPHDLRRTAATFMAQSGVMDEVIDAVLNHSKHGIIKVYNQYRYDKEKQIALEEWSWKLSSLLTKKAPS